MFINPPPGTRAPGDPKPLPGPPPTSGHSTNNSPVENNGPGTNNGQPIIPGQPVPRPEEIPSEWSEHHSTVGAHGQTVLLRAGLEENTLDALNNRPRLTYQPSGAPNFSLSLILERMPLGHETNIRPLVRRSILTLDVQVGLTPAILEGLKAELLATEKPKSVRRLFAHHMAYAVQWNGSETLLADIDASGAEGRAGLVLHLDQEQTLDVLSALHGTPSDFKICATIDYRQARSPIDIHLLGSWAEVHDYLHTHTDADGRINNAQLHQLILEMVQAHVLNVTMSKTASEEVGEEAGKTVDENSGETSLHPPADKLPVEEMVRAFMLQSVVILRKSATDEDAGVQWYRLRHRPHPFFTLDISFRASSQTMKKLTLTASLEELLGSVLDGLDWDDFVHLFAEEGSLPNAAGQANHLAHVENVRRVPKRSADQTKRSVTEPEPESERGPLSNNFVQMALVGNRLQSIDSISQLAPVRAKPAQEVNLATLQPTLQMRPAQINTAVFKPQIFHSEIIITPPDKDKPRNLPIVSNAAERYWRDRVDGKRYWYAPILEVVQPQANVEASQSPFLFTFERTGTLASGQPALRGTVRLTLQPTIEPATKQALDAAKITNAQAVPLVDVGVTLLIPFIDQNGQSKQHACMATIERSGDTLIATIQLINEWVRLGYGALARQGFQSRPVEVAIAYGFDAYIPIRKKDMRLTFGGKAIQLPMAFSESQSHQLQGGTFFDAQTLTLHNPRFDIQLHPETPGLLPGRSLSSGVEVSARNQPTPETPRLPIGGLRPTFGGIHSNIGGLRPMAPIFRPSLEIKPLPITTPVTTLPVIRPEFPPILDRVKYGRRKQTHIRKAELLFPCEQFGHLYRERKDGQEHATGCRPIADLGRIDYQSYEEITSLRHIQYSVYRSLQQPGQFLIVPTRFCIARHINTEGEQQAAILLYSHLDLQSPASSRIQLDVTLQPDIPIHLLRQLHDALSALAPEPQVFYPTDIPTDSVDVIWNLDDQISDERITNTLNAAGPFMRANFRVQFLRWPLMQNMLEHGGITGSVTFTLPDGTPVVSSLLMHLGQIRGPWGLGPLDIEQDNGTVRLTNKTAQSISVSDILVYDQSGTRQTFPVEAMLAPNASHNVPLAGGDAAIYPVYSYPSGPPVTIEEVRSTVEELVQGVQFVNLIALATHNLTHLDIQARLQGTETLYRTQLTAGMSTAEINMILSLTSYLNAQILEYRVTLRSSAAADRTTPWLSWNLNSSTIVSITSEQLGLI